MSVSPKHCLQNGIITVHYYNEDGSVAYFSVMSLKHHGRMAAVAPLET